MHITRGYEAMKRNEMKLNQFTWRASYKMLLCEKSKMQKSMLETIINTDNTSYM